MVSAGGDATALPCHFRHVPGRGVLRGTVMREAGQGVKERKVLLICSRMNRHKFRQFPTNSEIFGCLCRLKSR